MRVLLLYPWNSLDEGQTTFEHYYWFRRVPNLTIPHLASYIMSIGHNVAAMDLQERLIHHKGNLDHMLEELFDRISEFKPAVTGIHVASFRYVEALRLFRAIRQSFPKIKQIVGGPHPFIDSPDSIKDFEGVDSFFVGEAEIALKMYLEGVRKKEIPGIVSEEGTNVPGLIAENLDQFPPPAWDLFNIEYYTEETHLLKPYELLTRRWLPFLASRGCAFRCRFCSYDNAPPRWINPDRFVWLLSNSMDKYGVNGGWIVDTSLGNNRKWAIDFCHNMIQKGLNKRFRWFGLLRPDQASEELLALFKEAGCILVLYGFESGSQRVLDAMNKRCTVEDNLRAARLTREAGLLMWASFIFGYPGERIEDMKMTYEMVKKMSPDHLSINPFMPLPGTTIHRQLLKAGIIQVSNPEDWRDMTELNLENSYRIYSRIEPLTEEVYTRMYWKIADMGAQRTGEDSARPFKGILRQGESGFRKLATSFLVRLSEGYVRLRTGLRRLLGK